MLATFKELYEYRELLYNLVIKELKVKYRRSILGFFWSFLNPLLMMAVFTFIFSFVFRAGIKNFPIFFLVGFLPWNFFSMSLSVSTSSIVTNANLIKKVYFPREIIPFSIVLANLINFLLELIVLFIFLIAFGYNFWPYLPLLVVAILFHLLLSAGFGLVFSSITVYFRDIQQLIVVLLLVWFYATPVIYDMKMIPEKVQAFLKILNPMTSVILLYRQLLYHNKMPSLVLVGYAVLSSLTIFSAGYFIFKKLSPSFAKEI